MTQTHEWDINIGVPITGSGACCASDNTCIITTKSLCEATVGSVYCGDNTTCTTGGCPCTTPPPVADCNSITDPSLCVMPTCFWYNQYIWNTGSGATCHTLTQMLTDNWFIPVAVGGILLYLLIK